MNNNISIKKIKLVVVDVDGTLTDSGIYYDENGNEIKKFSTKDAAGFFALKLLGIKTAVLTGRECTATLRRLQDLKVDFIYQNIRDKASFLNNLMSEMDVSREEVLYIGDDVNDYFAMQLVDYVGCPKDSCKEVKALANYVSKEIGGHGAVRDIIECYLLQEKSWKMAITQIYNGCIEEGLVFSPQK